MDSPAVLSDALAWQAIARPEALACRDGGAEMTFGDWNGRADRVANALAGLGCAPGSRVAILAKNSLLFLEVLGGALKSGAVLLPLNWRLAPAELEQILAHAGAEVLVAEAEFAAVAARLQHRLAGPARVFAAGGAGGAPAYEDWRDAAAASPSTRRATPDEVFVQMYTSGTTGLPKGVQLTHAGYAASVAAMNAFPWARLQADDISFAPAPFFHVNGLNVIVRSLRAGGALVTVDQFRPAEAVEILETGRITRATLAPAMIQMCLETPGVEDRDFSHLRLITYGGSPISEAVLRRAREVFGCAFAQGYGMTEATGPVTMLHPADHIDDRRLTSCGRALPGIAVKVARTDGDAAAAGEVGEVLVSGPVVTPGYWRDAAATASAIRDGWLHTGDAGYLDAEGYLHIHDRVKDMIVSGGENVFPAEVENALANDPAIADVAVIGVPDERWGEAVKAIVVLRPGAEPDPQAIIRRVRAYIAGYKAPKSIDFVAAIPRNPAGKILRRTLREPYWAGRERAVN